LPWQRVESKAKDDAQAHNDLLADRRCKLAAIRGGCRGARWRRAAGLSGRFGV